MAARLRPGDVGMRVPSLLDDPVPAALPDTEPG
jgi:hypothetical protein